MAARIAVEPSSGAVTLDKAPPNLPIGVLALLRMTVRSDTFVPFG